MNGSVLRFFGTAEKNLILNAHNKATMAKDKFELEYILNASPSVLFPRLSTPSGLSDWFADDVNIKGDKYTFIWEGSEQVASVIQSRANISIRFKWDDDEDPKTYFEFKLATDDITNEVALVITDFADTEDVDDSIELWDAQIENLRHYMGL